MEGNVAHLAAGLGMGMAAVGTGLAIGLVAYGAAQGTARQPEASGLIRTTMLIGAALIESIALYTLVIAILLVSK